MGNDRVLISNTSTSYTFALQTVSKHKRISAVIVMCLFLIKKNKINFEKEKNKRTVGKKLYVKKKL